MGALSGKVALITGAAQGLGRAYAGHLAGQGAAVAVADVNAGGAFAVAEDIRRAGGVAEAVVMDVADEASVAAGVAAAVAALGPVGVLVYYAGGVLVPTGPAEAFGLEQWNRVLAVNLTGAWLCARAVIPQMKTARAGRIINISSTTFSQGQPTEMVPYIASKGGVVGLTRALARELGPFGVTVNAVAPGLVPPASTEGRAVNSAKLQSILDMVAAQQCVDRIGRADDLVGAVAFLASDASAFITGQVLNVDGGWALD
ncbi:MAG: short-chain dehydrogenase/reductase [Caulobacteraceae bacterium]|nr:short-chain dehydrogenase/reductase [Caulobacteraceae bacterium]